MRTSYAFIPNLRLTTFEPSFRAWVKPRGYLLPPEPTTAHTLELAPEVRRRRLRLYVDNGNFSMIGKLKARFGEEALSVLGEIRLEEKALRQRATWPELSQALRERIARLATEACTASNDVAQHDAVALAKQLSLKPTRIIGAENISMALLLALDLEPDYLPYAREQYRSMNEHTAERALSVMKELAPAQRESYYAVASAVSYDTAFDAGGVFARSGLRRIAMGFGAYMADDHYSDHVVIRDRSVPLSFRAPNRYLRTALVARGFWDGYTAEQREPPRAFHFLGLGAPIMLAIVALAAWGTPELSFDATSPIKDAVEGTLYHSEPAYLKVRTRKSSLRLAGGDGEHWQCPCPFCVAFVKKYPFDYAAGRRWFTSATHLDAPEVTAQDLSPGGELYSAYPLFSEPKPGPLRSAVDFARLGHNHWILRDVVDSLGRHAANRAELATWTERIVGAYEANTSSDLFARSVRLAREIALGNLPGVAG